MKAKKEERANLEKKVLPLTLLGITFSLAIVLVSFEWTSYNVAEATSTEVMIEELTIESVPVTIQEEKKEIPKIKEQKRMDVAPEIKEIEVVENNDDTKKEEDEILVDNDNLFGDETGGDGEGDGEPEPDFFVIVEDMPHSCDCGGITDKEEQRQCTEQAIYKHLSKNLKVPAMIRDARMKQTAYVSFIIDKKGDVADIKVLNDVLPAVKQEAARVVKSLPCFKPGKQRGKSVNVQYTIPITFRGM